MSDFVTYLKDVFNDFGPIQSRKMFGGYGIYHDAIMFGLVANSTLYLKADKHTAKDFMAKGLGPFEFKKGDKILSMSYYQAPEEIFDDPEAATHWAEQAFEVARRVKK